MELYDVYLGLCRSVSTGAGKASALLDSAPRPEEFFDGDLHALSEKGAITALMCDELEQWQDPAFRDSFKKDMEHKGIRFVPLYDDEYPDILREIPLPPLGLFVTGRLPGKDELCIAVIGSRGCSGYGRSYSYNISKELAENGVSVVSGMASGIDAHALRGALDGGGRAYAVLGCGTDICYPPENFDIYDKLPDRGGIVSEYPPGVQPSPWHFPVRNRIISGLSRGIFVAEAAGKSGTSITVERGLEQGRDIFALPGRAGDRNSEGTNLLIREGARAVWEAGHILAEYGLGDVKKDTKNKKTHLDNIEKLVYSTICCTPGSVETIAEKTGLSMKTLYQVLVKLQLKGLITEVGAQQYTLA